MTRLMGFVLAALVAGAAGCKSDLSQQLLERELRMQEDQIYQLQDELQDKCVRLDHVAGENQSLRRQLGYGDAASDRAGAARGRGPLTLPTPAEPVLVPPAIDLPGSAPAGGPAARPPAGPTGPAAPATIAPPALDGVPPLPVEPKFSDAVSPPAGGVIPAAAIAPTADAPVGQPFSNQLSNQLSHQESLADSGRISHLVVNPGRTECFDGNGDGLSDGLAIVVEPRDGDERLVTAAGDVVITVLDLSGPTGAPVARFEIPAQEALARFRRTSRNRGLHFVLRWPGSPPPGEHVRVHVALTTFDGRAFETDCTVATRPQPADVGGP